MRKSLIIILVLFISYCGDPLDSKKYPEVIELRKRHPFAGSCMEIDRTLCVEYYGETLRNIVKGLCNKEKGEFSNYNCPLDSLERIETRSDERKGMSIFRYKE